MNLYDFDHTIYKGDATVDFYLFCVRKHPAVLCNLPVQIVAVVLCKLKLMSRTTCKSIFLRFLRNMSDTEQVVEAFWDGYESKMKQWYLDQKHADDVIVSASPEFLLGPITQRLGLQYLIATHADIKTGKITGENNRGEEKVRRFLQNHPGARVEEAYSDSKSDLPILRLAEKAYIVKGNSRTQVQP